MPLVYTDFDKPWTLRLGGHANQASKAVRMGCMGSRIHPGVGCRARPFVAGLILSLSVTDVARSALDDVVKTIPADALAAYVVDLRRDPVQTGASQSSFALAAYLIDQAQEFGLLAKLDPSTRTTLDLLATLPLVVAHPHTVVLQNVEAAARPGGSHRLGHLQTAIVLHTRGDNEKIEHRIQHFLKAYTNTEDTTLTPRSLHDVNLYQLRDRRLPEWAELSWGRIGDYYLVAFGAGAADAVVGTIVGPRPNLGAQKWFADAWEGLDANHASFAVHLRVDRLREAGDPGFVEKVDNVLKELELQTVERGLWTLGRRGDAMVARGIVRRGGRDELHRITSETAYKDLVETVVPEGTRWHAVIDLDPKVVIRAVSQGYLAARSPEKRGKISEFWTTLQAESGVGIEDEILSRLHAPLIVYNFPRHALDLPFAWTRAFPIRGDAGALREKLDRLLETAQVKLQQRGAMQLRHDPDGVWCLRIGLDGPSLAVTDRFLIISFSPEAVRQNVTHLRAPPGPALKPQ